MRQGTFIRAVLAGVVAAGTGLLLASTATVGNAATPHTYYVAPGGSDSVAGTQSAPWASFAHAESVVQAGDTVYFRGGTYTYTHADSSCSSQTASVNAISVNKSGSAGALINYFAYPGERPVFDFFHVTNDCRIKGFDVTASYVHFKGLEAQGVPQNNSLNHESWAFWITGSDNVFEQLNLHNNMGPGLFIQDGGGNLVLNCDSHDNYDPHSSDGAGNNADGFGAHISANHPGNVFRGDRAWWNSDDGYDLINAFSSVTIEDSWSWRNGYLPESTTPAPAGNGNGFKAGGYGGVYVSNGVKHTIQNDVAFLNSAAGFYANHGTVPDNFFNNTSYDNHVDYNMLGISSSGGAVGIGYLRNNIAYGGTLTSNMSGTNAADNSWNLNVSMSDAQFQSVSTTGWNAARQADGSLPALPYLHLASNSSLIDRGVDVGLPYNGSAPDVGAFETGSGSPSPSPSSSASASASPSASASSGGGSSGEVHAVGAGRCLDVPGATQTNGTQLDIYDCTGGSGQIFAYNSAHELTVYGGAKCVDAYAKGTAAGTKVDLYDCNGGANQQWNINANGTITGVQSGLCLDVTNAATANGSPVELYTCNSGTNQQWTLG
jgi:hypothetical protein